MKKNNINLSLKGSYILWAGKKEYLDIDIRS